MARGDLSDAAWQCIAPLLPPENDPRKRGGRYKDHRTVINGILWILRTGAPWPDLPERYGPYQTGYDRLARWQKNGLWQQILEALQGEADSGRLPGQEVQWEGCALDSTSIKAHPHAAGARKAPAKKGGSGRCPPTCGADTEGLGRSRGGLSTKIHLLCDGKCRPLSLVLSQGHRNDSNFLEATLDGVRVARRSKGRPRKRPKRLRLDKGYSYAKCRRLLRRRGVKYLIPERRDQEKQRKKKGRGGGRPVAFEAVVYAQRNVVERCILRLKQWRRVATRYEKRAAMYLALVTLASIILWTR